MTNSNLLKLFVFPLLRQRYPHLHTRPCIHCRCRRGDIWIHPSLVEVEFKVYPVTDVVIDRRTDGDFFAAIGGEGTVLIQATVGTNVVPYSEIHPEMNYIIAEEKIKRCVE